MATTTEIDQIHTVPPPQNGTEPPRQTQRPRGRPRKCPECGEGIDPTKEHVCSAPVAAVEEVSSDEDFWLMLSNFTPEEWNHLTAYLYRVMPRIDRKANGKPINLGAYSTAFTRDDIMSEHGSGVYRIDLNQLEPASSRSRRIAREVFTIINPKYPPIVPPGDWVDDKVNDMWKWGAPAGVSSAAAVAGYPPGFNIKEVYDSAFQMAKALTPPPPVAKDDTVLTTLVTKLLDASLERPAPAPVDNSANERIFKMMDDTLKETRAELRALRDKQAEPPKSLIEQVKELKPMIAEVAVLFNGGRPAKHDWWEGPLEKIMDGVGEAVPMVVEMVRDGRKQQQPAVDWGKQPQAAALPGAQPVVAAAPSNVTPITEGQSPQPELTDDQKRFHAITQKYGGLILHVAPQMIDHFKTNEDGHGGYHFRDWFQHGHGMFRWADIKRDIGPEILLTMIANHPGLSAEMQPEAERQVFIKEFFTAPGEEDDAVDPPEGGDAA